MFIFHDEKPYYINRGRIYGVELDAFGYKIDESKSTDAPKKFGCTYSHKSICAVCGIVAVELLNKRTGQIEKQSSKTVKSAIDSPKYTSGAKPMPAQQTAKTDVIEELEV